MHGEVEGLTPGNALIVDPNKPFRKLNAFGNSFLNRFVCTEHTGCTRIPISPVEGETWRWTEYERFWKKFYFTSPSSGGVWNGRGERRKQRNNWKWQFVLSLEFQESMPNIWDGCTFLICGKMEKRSDIARQGDESLYIFITVWCSGTMWELDKGGRASMGRQTNEVSRVKESLSKTLTC